MRSISKVAERYSAAFFQAAKSSNLLDKVEQDFIQLEALVSNAPDITDVLSNPLISREKLEDFLHALGERLNLQDVTIKFLRLLARRRRTNVLAEMITHFNTLLRQERKQLFVEIQAHSNMLQSQVEDIENFLHDKTGHEIMLDINVDPSILGGIVIQYGSYKLDFSLKRKLTELKHELERLG